MRFSKSESPRRPQGGAPREIRVTGCGADRDRTDDIQLAKLALSQLSYSPVRQDQHGSTASADPSRFGDGPRWTRTTDLALIRRAL